LNNTSAVLDGDIKTNQRRVAITNVAGLFPGRQTPWWLR